jgi:hypothetical protein
MIIKHILHRLRHKQIEREENTGSLPYLDVGSASLDSTNHGKYIPKKTNCVCTEHAQAVFLL